MDKLDHKLVHGPNNNYEIMTDVHGNANCRHMPYKCIKFKKHKHKHSQWITNP